MTPPDKVTVKINLVDGTQRTFTFQPPPNQDLRIAARIKEFLNRQSIAFQLPEGLLVIPMTQVKSVQFSAAIDKQIDGVFGNAKEVVS